MSSIRVILLVIFGMILGGIVGGFFGDSIPVDCHVTPGDAGSAISCALNHLIAGVATGAVFGAFLLPVAVMTLSSLFRRQGSNPNR